ncbi:Os08g0412001 [Oryza sativa Japonica Group]|uniref:Os08g0412001 protein n=1 Tax=Oryza sativa subsp. japonica TaxID=39947 RepID=A0A0P0XFW2_ORYSJ|nr:Os08g0412001 [Oryza sativa Japonica Group]
MKKLSGEKVMKINSQLLPENRRGRSAKSRGDVGRWGLRPELKAFTQLHRVPFSKPNASRAPPAAAARGRYRTIALPLKSHSCGRSPPPHRRESPR